MDIAAYQSVFPELSVFFSTDDITGRELAYYDTGKGDWQNVKSISDVKLFSTESLSGELEGLLRSCRVQDWNVCLIVGEKNKWLSLVRGRDIGHDNKELMIDLEPSKSTGQEQDWDYLDVSAEEDLKRLLQ